MATPKEPQVIGHVKNNWSQLRSLGDHLALAPSRPGCFVWIFTDNLIGMASRSDLPRINQCRWNGKPDKAARAKRRLKPNMPRKLESVSIHPIYSINLQYLSTLHIYRTYLHLQCLSIYSIYLQYLSIDRSIDLSYPILSSPLLSSPILSYPILSYLSILPTYLPTYLSIYLSVCLSIYLSIYLFIYLSNLILSNLILSNLI